MISNSDTLNLENIIYFLKKLKWIPCPEKIKKTETGICEKIQHS
jgi:hypothetical protein